MVKTKKPPKTIDPAPKAPDSAHSEPDLSHIAANLRPLAIRCDSLVLDPANSRVHPSKNLEAIKGSLRSFGQVKPLVVREGSLIVVCGNGTLAAARALGWQWIAANVLPLTDMQATSLSIADNRTSDLSDWDEEVLNGLLRSIDVEDPQLAAMFEEMKGWAEPQVTDDVAPVDQAAALQQKWKTEAGQLWEIPSKSGTDGKCHRLLCGDSTVKEDVARVMDGKKAVLMATDPPYLVDYQGGNHPRSMTNNEAVKNKHHADYHEAEDPEFFDKFLRVALEVALEPNAAIYQWHAHRRQALVEEAWKKNGLLLHQQIIWVKARPVLTYSHFMWKHEPCFYGWREGGAPARKPSPDQTTVWELNQQGKEGIHPTEKPVQIATRPMHYHTGPGDICFEPFSGSGTCLSAAEQTGRLCYAIEKAPAFVAVALERLAKLGLEPRLAATCPTSPVA
jgi:DNA modification methylase